MEMSKAQRVSFLQTALSVGYLVGATDKDVKEIFAPNNTVAKTLNPQEKRNALFSGYYKQFCLKGQTGHGTLDTGTKPVWRQTRRGFA